MHSVRQQRGRQRVTGITGIGAAIESEIYRISTLDAAARFGAETAAHGVVSPGFQLAWNRSDTVSRDALKYRPQPCVWRQRSACGPRGLLRWYRKTAHSSSFREAGSAGRAILASPA